MSLSAQDIVALARAGYNAEQISFLNKETLSTPSTEQSTQSTQTTEPAQPTVSTQNTELSTPPAEPDPKPAPEVKAPDPKPEPPKATVDDLLAKLASLENQLTRQAINNSQQPEQEDVLTGEKVLAQILDPRIK